MIKIEPLTSNRLEETINLLNTVFPNDTDDPAGCLRASLNPEKYAPFFLKTQIPELRYWVAINNLGKVVGTTGLYCYKSDREEAFWLGWFSVEPEARNKGIGTQLLQFSIEKAKGERKKFLRLYTSTDFKDAIRLYEKHGVGLTKEEPYPDTELKKLYYELKF